MKYLLLEYGEKPLTIADIPKVKYSYEQNLNVIEQTDEPAIDLLENLLATETMTFVNAERPDTDANIHSIAMSLITGTTTKVEMESTDQD